VKLEEKIKTKFLYSHKLNLFKILYFSFQYLKSKFKPRIINANWGIDVIVDSILKNKKSGFYIDVGCHHPLINNNTYLLFKRGWKGINIDLDFNSIDMFNYFRPNDDNQKLAISDKKGEAKLFFFHNRAPKNTLNKLNGRGSRSIKKIKTDTLNNIIKKSKIKINQIDFLTIDVEGNELEVLKGLNLGKYKPKVIALELINKNINTFYEQDIKNIQMSKIYKYLTQRKYKLANWVHDDLIFVSKKFINKK
jgi:FkbM family methyltransferase|tara:strand:+ start:7007 stop:7756 length:750 start_codon:yes stop_codon:yes gene_type:complete